MDGISEIALNERFVDPEDLTEDFYPIDKDFIDLAPMVHDAQPATGKIIKKILRFAQTGI